MTRLDIAKERLTIPDLARKRGWDWEPGRACRVPYRVDKSPSGGVYADGRLLYDHSTGETLDAPALLARVENLTLSDACRLFIQVAEVPAAAGEGGRRRRRRKAAVVAAAPPPPPLEKEKPELPPLLRPTGGQLRVIAEQRGLSLESVTAASARGLLWCCEWRGMWCWAVADAARWLCQVRRLNGLPFRRKDDEHTFKAWTLPRCRAGWPLGIGEAASFPFLALCEGAPDMLAVLHLACVMGCLDRVAPVAMLGASTRIVADALPLFAGKRVRLFPHADAPRDDGRAPGLEAAARWQDQLTAAGAPVDVFDLSGLVDAAGAPIKDLNDLARLPAATLAADAELCGMFEP